MPGMKCIRYITRGVQALAQDKPSMLDKLHRAFAQAIQNKDDWFYKIEIDGQSYFVADNGEDGYTAMLPEEY
jgi:hypothetical protein